MLLLQILHLFGLNKYNIFLEKIWTHRVRFFSKDKNAFVKDWENEIREKGFFKFLIKWNEQKKIYSKILGF